MNKNFKKASELLYLKNNIDTTDELKEKLSRLENVNLSEIHGQLKLSTSKESYERPSIETLQKYVATAKLQNTKKNTKS